MNDKIFLDSNIVVYSYSNSEPTKQIIARKLMADNHAFISTQVLQELTNTITRKFGFSYIEAVDAINECCQNNLLHTNTTNTILQACTIAERYEFSFYDSLIVAAAMECHCAILYSEDLTNQQIVLDKLKIINPFL
jgi:predicted nucleic acid-binding protein